MTTETKKQGGQQQQDQRETKSGRKFRVRSKRCQLIKPYGQSQVRTVDKDEEIVVDTETKNYLCQTGGVGGSVSLAVLIGEET